MAVTAIGDWNQILNELLWLDLNDRTPELATGQHAPLGVIFF